MITIYSVLIQNKETLNQFREYEPLFADSLEKGNIGICEWNESGDDMRSALPGIDELVNDKKEWRAIIVVTEPGKLQGQYTCSKKNPYDFDVNKDKTEEDLKFIKESEVPLIRLSNILGGIPSVPPSFELKIIDDENGKAPYPVYEPTVSEEAIAAHKELADKYNYDGRMPEEIIMINLRKAVHSETEIIDKIYQRNKEQGSSEFWKRNAYPSTVRFLTFDVTEEGPVKRDEDMFRFWNSVLTLATNHINPSGLQAYRLYRIDSQFNSNRLSVFLKKLEYRINEARKYVFRTIEYEEKMILNERRELPDCECKIPVSLSLPRSGAIEVNSDEFDILPKSISSDHGKWRSMQESIEDSIQNAFKQVDRSLDDAADLMRNSCTYPEEMIYPLTDHQLEDMNDNLDNQLSSILTTQSILPNRGVAFKSKLDKAADKVKKNISTRMTLEQAIYIAVLIVSLVAISSIPGVLIAAHTGITLVLKVLIIGLITLLIFGVVGVAFIIYRKVQFNRAVGEYNSTVRSSVGELYRNNDLYQDYLSGIATHAKGRSYLYTMRHKDSFKDVRKSVYYHYIELLDSLAVITRAWAVANHADDTVDTSSFTAVEISGKMSNRQIMTKIFNFEEPWVVDFNETGEVLNAPYSYFSKFEIVREELYDDSINA